MKNWLAFVLFLQALSLHSQVIKVLDKDTQLPVEFATLMSENPKSFLTTGENGMVDISGMKGSLLIEFRSLGYQTKRLTYDEIIDRGLVVKLTATAIEIEDIVIAATRSGRNAGNIPQSIRSIGVKEISFQNPQTAADMLGITGEVFIQKSQQGGGSPMIRGFAANRLLYVVDGVRMNTAIFRGGNLHNVISLDPLILEKTEVLFGPGSVMYGSDAVGGVMSFQTIKPLYNPSDSAQYFGKAMTRYSSANNELTGHVHFGWGKKRWGTMSSITYSDYGDLQMGRYGPEEYLRYQYVQTEKGIDKVVSNENPMLQVPSGYKQLNVMQKVRYQPSDKLSFEYGFHYSGTSKFSRYDRLIESGSNGTPRSAEWYYGPQKWLMNQFSIHHRENKLLYDNLSIRIAHQFSEESRFDRGFSGPSRYRLRSNIEDVHAFSVNSDFEKLKGKHTLNYGIEYILNRVNSNGSAIDIRDGSPILVPDRYPNSYWHSGGLYGNYQHHINPYWSAHLGFRYTFIHLESDFTRHLSFYPLDIVSSRIQSNAPSGSIGIVYHKTHDWKIAFNLGSAFRAPNVDDVGKIFDFVATEIVVPNISLRPEYAYSGEIQVVKFFGDKARVQLTGFATYLDGAMVRRAYQVNGSDSIEYGGERLKTFAIQNAAYAWVYGGSIGLDLNLSHGFSFNTRFSIQEGWEEMENGTISSSRHAPPAFGLSRLTYSYRSFVFQFYSQYSGGVTYNSLNEEERQKPVIYAKDSNGNPYSPGWVTFNLKASYAINSSLFIHVGIENIGDVRYRPYSSGLVAPGRNFIISTRCSF